MPDFKPRFRLSVPVVRAGVVLACLLGLAACGDDDDAATAAQAEADAPGVAVEDARCPAGDALIARVRALEADGSDAEIRGWVDDVRAGGDVNDTRPDEERSGCASFATLDDDQTERYVALLYNGPAAMAPALALHQTPAAQKAILRAYRDDPDAVSDNPGLAAALAMAQIQQGESYEAAYEDLSFAALNDGIDPAYVRGYLNHFGCGYEDAVWAAKSKERIDFLAGDAFPTSTSVADTAQSELVNDRMALLKQKRAPTLRSDCPLSARYAADHNGDTLTRLKLKAQQLSDDLQAKFGEYADMFARDDDNEPSDTGEPKRSALEKFEDQMAEQYAALERFARESGELASARWQYCANRFDRSFDFDAVADCVKAQPSAGESKDEADNETR
ncbi:hypothetical protein [Salinisphaera sp.]|uniref:hypothetical protein n=1 Tax=Salinisphaera sp. TaxID=1914330 RepID=UPI000C675F73|nr:hypothetical protein [Salinisphaera sp.]MBS63794.1 hypothetical protein [Salinisphaera sp.]